jgi:hypothetical protein
MTANPLAGQGRRTSSCHHPEPACRTRSSSLAALAADLSDTLEDAATATPSAATEDGRPR